MAQSLRASNAPSFSPKLRRCPSFKDASVHFLSHSEKPTHEKAADLIQDLYLKELRAYKPPPQKASDAEGQVHKFTPPAVPKSPEETNLASEMKEYEDQVVEIEGQAAPGETQPEEDFFEDIEEEDAPAHH
ncbi:hypothetical protein AYO21_05672 [Fonsecaea monophora]|uniref:F-type H+-transporting ATPase subunit H n=2 Tax=Fonsecaea TaxID=40354 RepID=A0A0D2H7X9_9EURO|nr:uncharacterized protein Z517_07401 [Fonsecaea pedrosoi CBS 271.37]XP_022512146.1 hypothetical protein AYO21_05672 [Fonsecaea monophora]KAH0839256.1 ATP synthase H chain, precursor [Fonsecaea pedrosoi]KIW80784.1 hypothetical protein Z517_07401 [Fonsecaea pedrosoi CBS 271.37]OAG40194.1 hypothetical protein AYO21_05672 [Fonsecaea monophora]